MWWCCASDRHASCFLGLLEHRCILEVVYELLPLLCVMKSSGVAVPAPEAWLLTRCPHLSVSARKKLDLEFCNRHKHKSHAAPHGRSISVLSTGLLPTCFDSCSCVRKDSLEYLASGEKKKKRE